MTLSETPGMSSTTNGFWNTVSGWFNNDPPAPDFDASQPKPPAEPWLPGDTYEGSDDFSLPWALDAPDTAPSGDVQQKGLLASFGDWLGEARETVSEGFDSALESTANFAIDHGFDDLVEGWNERLTGARNETVAALDRMGGAIEGALEDVTERAAEEILDAEDALVRGGEWVEEKVTTMTDQALDTVDELTRPVAEVIAGREYIQEAMATTAQTFVSIGFEVGIATAKVGESLWEHRNELWNEGVSVGIERLENGLDSTAGGKMFSAAMEAGAWSENLDGTVGFWTNKGRDLALEKGAEAWRENDGEWISKASGAAVDHFGDVARSGSYPGWLADQARDFGREIDGHVEKIENVFWEVDHRIEALEREALEWQVENPENSWPEALALAAFGDESYESLDIQGDDEKDPNPSIFVNGIWNKPKDAIENAETVHKATGENVLPFYNPTDERNKGIDMLSTQFNNKPNLLDRSTAGLISQIRHQLANNPGENVRLHLHSQGAALGSAALSYLSMEERARIDVISYGGAAYSYPPGLRSLNAIVNVRDTVPNLVGAGFPGMAQLGSYERNGYTIRYIDRGEDGNWETTHGMETYLNALEDGTTQTRWGASLERLLWRGDE